MDDGDIKPSHLPNWHSLRQLKYKSSMLCLSDTDPIISLYKLMNSNYKNIISAIGFAPFYIFFMPCSRKLFGSDKSRKKLHGNKY